MLGTILNGWTFRDTMFSLFTSIGPEIPLSLLLMGLLGLRAKIWPRASLHIKASPDKVFEVIDFQDGKMEDWGRTSVSTELVDHERRIFRKTFSTTLTSGIAKSSSALFSVQKRVAPHELEIHREGLDGKSLNNELLSLRYEITPEGEGSRLTTTYEWGPRPLIAQLVARADLWGGAYRLRALAERGTADNSAYQVISAAVAVLTGAISFVAFALLLGWLIAGLLIVALFIHELGHLLAYRLMGQPWGRMVFLPFLGAIAIPRLPFDSQGQSVFAALMGPGLSVILSLACTFHILTADGINPYIASLGLVATVLNVFNLLPAEPLDGGVALRSVLTKLMGDKARYGLMAIGLAIAAVGLLISQILLVIFGGLAILFNFKDRKIDSGLAPLSSLQVSIAFFGYTSLVTAYMTMLGTFNELFQLLNR
jgi:Zn-dependent protease